MDSKIYFVIKEDGKLSLLPKWIHIQSDTLLALYCSDDNFITKLSYDAIKYYYETTKELIFNV